MELEEYPEVLSDYLAVQEKKAGKEPTYRSSHFPEVDDYIGHYRKKIRTSPEGEKIFHLEELQSDRAQEGRKRGFRNPEAALLHKNLDERRSDIVRQEQKDYVTNRDEFQRKIAPIVEDRKSTRLNSSHT